MIDKLSMFMVLAREEHFGRAAEALGITQPSLSSAIKALEEQLGVQLVRRGSRYQGLTPEGERVLDWARRIVGDARAMQSEMEARRRGVSGLLRLGVIPTAMPRIAELTGPFLKRHPNAGVSILSRSSDEIRDQIEALELDAGVTYLDSEPLGRVQVLPLYRETYCLISRDEDRGPVGWAEAARRPLCLLTPDMQNRRIVTRHLVEAGADAMPRVESTSMLAILSHVATGDWAAILPRSLARGLPLPQGVSARDLSGEGHMVGLVTARREPHPPLVEALIRNAGRSAPEDAA
ncbi:LysR family transcriptional regulator [Paracoccus yeei]|uniref:LysR family transcriptional regulator n=2 Tax=Paracoccus TaxID=265 RepID=A0A1V0GPM6_9RHOB|nr:MULTISPECIES: LysR family transcriptional regulator [Paracoccus]ARC35803.1 LysR family transcriptional regulator [Paracoccus yeei]AWX92512.1 LysR family transcriptional regulator [Paracoccus mutanolyticus]AYF01701.1 LysR family transcriptional regulator [Paracoccus yeei]MBY0136598.1 LysR family transcriptional regulator [Paracoccus yeei]OWJ94341.1 LysR family transcriptional regulator [Paracoccus yeei]